MSTPLETSKRGSAGRWRKWLKWVLLAGVAILLIYVLKFRPLPVAAVPVAAGVVVAEVVGTGTLEARVKTTVSPRIQERLAEVLVDQGSPVGAGQLLARLDDGELKQQVAVATAALAAARSSAERVRTEEARARAVEQQARLTHQRIADLVATKVASQDELDKAIEALQVAEAEVRRTAAAITEAERHVVTAEKTLLYHEERLGYVELRSPYDGLVIRRDRDPGTVVVPGSSVLQLIATNEIWVSAWVDETAMSGLAVGQPARVVFRSEPGAGYPGEVARLGRETDRETREFLVDVRVGSLPANWAVGQRAEVYVETARKSEALAVPPAFLQTKQGVSGVFVVEGGRARWREVTLGLRGTGSVEIVRGLQAGDRVICPRDPGRGVLREGQRVVVK